MLLLLVQNHQAKATARCEHRRSGSHNHPGIAAAHPFPLVIPFPYRQAAVQYGHLTGEVCRQQAQKLGRQADFRHHQQRAFAVIQTFPD